MQDTAVAPYPARAGARPRPAPRRAADRRRRRLLALLLAPWAIGVVVFFGYPLVSIGYLSFTHYDLLSAPRWIGLANYAYMLRGDQQLGQAVRNTLWVLLILVPCQVLFSFGIGLLLSRARRGVGLLRTVFYLPSLTPLVAAAMGFLYVFNPGTGPVNQVLAALGVTGPPWYTSPGWAKPSLTVLAVWGSGNLIVIFLAALLQVPRDLYEAADLDGAGPLSKLRHVTLPVISPVVLFAVVTTVIDGLQYFDQAYVVSSLGNGGAKLDDGVLGYPEGSTLFFPLWLYQQGFRYFNMGYASALAVVMLVVALGISSAILLRSRSFVHQTGGTGR
ncbi:carbohydrate ABC transporter permease [Actinocatenispora rupis]|uniref:Sugar ABC transporter permease n=1 Tax=Actinocatenispora rupis TaxID=519421 RepID=A0A8J3JA07_9ACTN|nr:sugar ABC transporter permease [Actinocatenispora rupis]GID10968.1 sugar ABC transporter permease [Actinocatenispora rupis]